MASTYLLILLLIQAIALASGQSTGQIKTAGSNTCLSIANSNLSNGAKVINQACTVSTSVSQTWQFKAASVAGKTALLTANNFCLDVPNGNAYNGAPLQIWTCNSANSNQFFAKNGNTIQWNSSPYCLDVYHGVSSKFSNGLSIVLWQCSSTSTNEIFTGPAMPSVITSSIISTITTTSQAVTTSSTPTPASNNAAKSSTSTVISSTTSLTAVSSPKPALTSIFIPSGKIMLAYGYDSTVAAKIGTGPMISSYHHWEDNVITQMPTKDTYIPTYWGTSKNASWAAVKATLGSTIPPVVMGFNEPDISTQANIDPNLAAWIFYNEITIPFGNKGSNVVSPAIVWNLNGWLKPFMTRCAQLGCNIDAIGQHIYVSLNGDVNAAIASAKSQINAIYAAFGKPIVLSEIGLTASGGGTPAQILAFVQGIGNWLDDTDYVLAWALSAVFSTGNGWDGYLNSNMAFFNPDKSLTDLAYRYMYDTF